MAISHIQTLSEAIKCAYKSLEQPDFSFVNTAISLRPYDPLIQQIRKIFEVEEITDSNDDVSFCYLLSKPKDQWVIELSMLGRYAVVFRISDVGAIKIVTQNASVPEEQEIFSLLRANEFEVLEQRELEQSFPLKLSNTDSENVCIYQALFSDTDVLPWKTPLKGKRP